MRYGNRDVAITLLIGGNKSIDHNGYVYETLGIAWLRTYPPLMNLQTTF